MATARNTVHRRQNTNSGLSNFYTKFAVREQSVHAFNIRRHLPVRDILFDNAGKLKYQLSLVESDISVLYYDIFILIINGTCT